MEVPSHSSRQSPLKGRQRGFSFIEVMVAVTILGIVIAATTSFFGQVQKSKRKNRLRQTQERLAAMIRNSVKSPSHVLYSITRHDINPTLSYCVLGVGQAEDRSYCGRAKNRKHPVPFGLYQVSSGDGSKGDQISSGEKGARVFYDLDGNVCNSKSKDGCVLEARTSFYVTCNDRSDPKCIRGVNQVFFQYQIVQVKKVRAFGQSLPPYPKKPRVIPLTAVQILGPHRYNKCGGQTDRLKGDASQGDRFAGKFGKGHFGNLVGYDNSGNPICKCLYPFVLESEKKDPVTGMITPVCRLLSKEELACTSDSEYMYLRGYKGDDNIKAAVCVDAESAFDCTELVSGDTCPTTAWLTTLTGSSCTFSCEFVPNKQHICGVEWDTRQFVAAPTHNEGDDQVFADFYCYHEEKYCCEPAIFH